MDTPPEATAEADELRRYREERLVLESVLGTSHVTEIVKLVQALEARGGRSESDATIASLVTQIESLYADREALVAVLGPDITNGLHSLLKERDDLEAEVMNYRDTTQASGPVEDAVPADTVASLVAQLESMYRDQEALGSPAMLAAQVESLVEQLESLYQERELGDTEAQATIESLTEQLHNIYADQEKYGAPDVLAASNESLVEQLESMYEERQAAGDQQRLMNELVAANQSLVEQLEDLYASQQDVDALGSEVDSLRTTNRSLQEQLESLYAERAEARDEAERMAPVVAAIDRLGERLLAAVGSSSRPAPRHHEPIVSTPTPSVAAPRPAINETNGFGNGFSLRF